MLTEISACGRCCLTQTVSCPPVGGHIKGSITANTLAISCTKCRNVAPFNICCCHLVFKWIQWTKTKSFRCATEVLPGAALPLGGEEGRDIIYRGLNLMKRKYPMPLIESAFGICPPRAPCLWGWISAHPGHGPNSHCWRWDAWLSSCLSWRYIVL